MQIPRFSGIYRTQPQEVPSTIFDNHGTQYWATGDDFTRVVSMRNRLREAFRTDEQQYFVLKDEADLLHTNLAKQAAEGDNALNPVARVLLDNVLIEDKTGLDILALVMARSLAEAKLRSMGTPQPATRADLRDWAMADFLSLRHISPHSADVADSVLKMLKDLNLLERRDSFISYRLSKTGIKVLEERRPELFEGLD